FGFGEQLGLASGSQSLARMPVPRPEKIQIEQDGPVLRFTQRWFSAVYIFVALFAVVWNSFMAVWFGIAINSRMWPMALFGTLHAALGLIIAYIALGGFINSTVIRV